MPIELLSFKSRKMKREEADKLIKEAETFIGMQKPVITESQLGLPSIIEDCKFDGILLKKDKDEFFPMACMTSINTETLILHEDLHTTLEYLRRQAG
jgi:hypothetical protein